MEVLTIQLKAEYDPKLTGIKYENKIKYQPGKIQAMKFKQAMYKLRNLGGKSDTGVVNLSFLSATYYEPKASKEYSFEKYNAGYDAHSAEDKYEEEKAKKKKETLKNYHFNDDIPDEVDPIKQTHLIQNIYLIVKMQLYLTLRNQIINKF